jgi:hypothetical protein
MTIQSGIPGAGGTPVHGNEVLMRRSLILLVLGLTLLPLLGCSSGDACDKCSSDSDCNSGFVCSTFSDGSKRCGHGDGSTTCRTLR